MITTIHVSRVQCFTHRSFLDWTHTTHINKPKFLFKSYLVEIMDDSKCKPFLTDILKDNYRNIICAKSSNGEIINSKANKIHEASDIREVCNKLGNIIPLFLSNFVVTHSTETKQWYLSISGIHS